MRLDAGLSQRALADAAGTPQSHLSEIERGASEGSIAVLVAIGQVLGADLSVRLFPGAGPRVRDRLQAPMVEALLRLAGPSWKRLLEVAVRAPARGVIDAVLAQPSRIVIATEVHSELRRVEQQIRWSIDKAASLPSAHMWSMLTGGADHVRVERLLVLRNTRANRELVTAFDETFRTVYPAAAHHAFEALATGTEPFPASAVLWCNVTGGVARMLDRPPRGVALGR